MLEVLFYATASGRQVVKEWIKSFSKADQKILGEDLMVVQFRFPLGAPICAPLGDGLWEVRSTLTGNREARMIICHDDPTGALIVLNGFIKKSQKTPKRELDVARARRRDFSP